MLEIAKHSCELSRTLRYEKLLHPATCARIVQLKVKDPTLRELARDAFVKHKIIRFCTNIINAHILRASGGSQYCGTSSVRLC